MGRSSSSDSTSRSSKSSRKEVKKSKKNKSEKRSRHNSQSPDSRRKRSRTRSRDRNRLRRKSRSRSRERHVHSDKKSRKSNRTSRSGHSKSKKRSRSKDYSTSSRSRRSSASTAGSSAENSTDSEQYSSDKSSIQHSQGRSKRSHQSHVGNVTIKRTSRESATPSNQSNTTTVYSREGSCGHDEFGKDKKLLEVKTSAVAAEKSIEIKQRESAAADSSVDVVAKLRMDTAIREVETSSFEQRTFKSSRSQQKNQQTSNMEMKEQFQFGTSAEKAAVKNNGSIGDKPISNILMAMAGEGLCHPNLFGDPVKREERWFDYLIKLRQSIHAEKKSADANETI